MIRLMSLLLMTLAPACRKDDLQELQNLLRREMEVTRTRGSILLAVDSHDKSADLFKLNLANLLQTIEERAFKPSPVKTLLICRTTSPARYQDLAQKLFGKPVRPPWLMAGLALLSTPGTIQEAFKANKLPRLDTFLQMKGVDFQDRARGRNLLLHFYRNLRKTRMATALQDPFCLKALEKEAGRGIAEIEKDFLSWLK